MRLLWNTANAATFPHRRPGALVLELAAHVAMGTATGLGFCFLMVLMGRYGLANVIAHNAEPRITAIVLVGFTSLIFAVGATLTGMVLMTLEESWKSLESQAFPMIF